MSEASDQAEAAPESGDEADKAEKADKKPGKIQQLVLEYGAIGLIVFLSISALVYTGFVIAISAGWETEGAGEEAGVWVAAYVGLQLTKPIRIPLVLVLTPIVARVWHRMRGREPKVVAGDEGSTSSSDEG